MKEVIDHILSELDLHPILIDVGSSGETPAIWGNIARHSTYIGFDPDERDPQSLNSDCFYRYIIVDRAVTDQENSETVTFCLTKYPHCSSSLRPDSKSLSSFLFADFFNIERDVRVKATSLNQVLEEYHTNSIDWLKIDSQGTDLRIFNSLNSDIRSRLLVLDVEPGIIDAYLDEDLFVDTHKNLVEQGFWLSNINVCGAIRCSSSAIKQLITFDNAINVDIISQSHRKTPAWCEARYLRTLEWIIHAGLSKREYILMWVFSVMDLQLCFAAEVIFAYEENFGRDQISLRMLEATISQLKAQSSLVNKSSSEKSIKSIISNVKSFLPIRLKKFLRVLVNRKSL